MLRTKLEYDQNNKVILLCAKGMELEGQGRQGEASNLFNEAWSLAINDFEKFTAAHYVARHQNSTSDKLIWDEKALQHALQINDPAVKEALPSLYLNIGKCYEDLGELENAKSHYQKAFSFIDFLQDDGYGNMIRAGIINGLERVK